MQDVLVLKEGEMFLEHKILALCDPETDYAGQLAAYLQDSREFPWEIRIFTGISQLTESEKSEEIDLLLVAESVYFPELPVVFDEHSGDTGKYNAWNRIGLYSICD